MKFKPATNSVTNDVANALYGTKFHRDGTVTVWNVWTQQWHRTNKPSDNILASLDAKTRERVIRHTTK